MLQQTRIATVLAKRYFERWMEKFPNLSSLAEANESELLKAWEGLGYYNRSRNLQKAARQIIADHNGIFPDEIEAILALPGVGRYTAGAVLSFAFHKPAPIVDGNVARVLTRIFAYDTPVDQPAGRKQLWQWAEQLVPSDAARDFNSGLMELGQQICLTTDPLCLHCPVNALCRGKNQAHELPKKLRQTTITETEEHAAWIEQGDRILLTKSEGSRRQGLWKLPGLHAPPESPAMLALSYAITRYKVRLHIHRLPAATEVFESEQRWVTSEEIDQIPLGSPYRKAIHRILERENC